MLRSKPSGGGGSPSSLQTQDMVKLKLLVGRAHIEGYQYRGDEIQVSEAEAVRMIAKRQAQRIQETAAERMAEASEPIAPPVKRPRGRPRKNANPS